MPSANRDMPLPLVKKAISSRADYFILLTTCSPFFFSHHGLWFYFYVKNFTFIPKTTTSLQHSTYCPSSILSLHYSPTSSISLGIYWSFKNVHLATSHSGLNSSNDTWIALWIKPKFPVTTNRSQPYWLLSAFPPISSTTLSTWITRVCFLKHTLVFADSGSVFGLKVLIGFSFFSSQLKCHLFSEPSLTNLSNVTTTFDQVVLYHAFYWILFTDLKFPYILIEHYL